MHIIYFLSIFVILISHLAVHDSSKCEQLSVSVPKVHRIHQFSSHIPILIHKLPQGNYDTFYITLNRYSSISFFPNILLGVDFKIMNMKPENFLPYYVRRGRNRNSTMMVGLKLLPGKSWLGKIYNSSSLTPTNIELKLSYFAVCPDMQQLKSYKTEMIRNRKPASLTIAVISQRVAKCPKLPKLRDAQPEFQKFLDFELEICANVKIIKSKKLSNHRTNSLSLLSHHTKILLIDANDQNDIINVAKLVDNFLAPHSVLDVVWEPYTAQDPRWFILMPRVRGMPGHLFAMLDIIQWEHPAVKYNITTPWLYNQCKADSNHLSNCTMGCPGTFISRSTGSGWGADTWHVILDVRRVLVWNEPLQITPHAMLKFNRTVGYEYTYGSCPTNFFDCNFLAHSPCPTIRGDPWYVWPTDKSRPRIKGYLPNLHELEQNGFNYADTWWNNVFGPYKKSHNSINKPYYIPPQSYDNKHGMPAEHSFFAYVFRPNYELRQQVHKKVEKFQLNNECAALHVRRGDSVAHLDLARAYIRIESYVRAGKPLMDAMGINTIMLFTDSQSAIDEAMNCAKEFPDVCQNIKFRFLTKKRFYGAEGGWENPFPDNPVNELLSMQTEFSLVQKCAMIITGESSYGQKLKSHMCCGFPLQGRGKLPRRCICPPEIQLKQRDIFNTCQQGNKVFCHDGTFIDAINFTQSHNIVMNTTEVRLITLDRHIEIKYKTASMIEIQNKYKEFIDSAMKFMCRSYDNGPPKPRVCANYVSV